MENVANPVFKVNNYLWKTLVVLSTGIVRTSRLVVTRLGLDTFLTGTVHLLDFLFIRQNGLNKISKGLSVLPVVAPQLVYFSC